MSERICAIAFGSTEPARCTAWLRGTFATCGAIAPASNMVVVFSQQRSEEHARR